jgi:hypothetical protein
VSAVPKSFLVVEVEAVSRFAVMAVADSTPVLKNNANADRFFHDDFYLCCVI